MIKIKSLTESKEQNSVSHSGYNFNATSRKWKISRDNTIYLSWVDEFILGMLRENFLKLLKHYAETYSAGHTNNLSDRFREFARFVHSTHGKFDKVCSTQLISYRSTLEREHEWYLGALRGFFKLWIELGYGGIDKDVSKLLDGWRLKGNIKGRAVQTLCPKEGALSDLEFEALYQSLLSAFELGNIDIEDFVLVRLFMATGRRPAQLGDLKAKDLVQANAGDGLQEFFINVPRRKQSGLQWRGVLKPFAVIPDIGILVKELILSNKSKLSMMGIESHQSIEDELPIFPSWSKIRKLTLEHSIKNLEKLFYSQDFHLETQELSKRLKMVVGGLSIFSERTGEYLKIFPTRLRRTLATRAAREGFGELVIAELLDHTDTQNARVYTENVPEHVDAINKAVAQQLAPLAQAFAGVLVDKESDAVRGDDITSRVRCENGSVGTCGHHGFCGALAPVACYTCRNFQPWVDGPHDEILDSLIADRDRILEVTKDKTMAAINDRTILAVTQVIQKCEVRKQQISKELSHG